MTGKPANPVAEKRRRRKRRIVSLVSFAAFMVILFSTLGYIAKVTFDEVYGGEYELLRSVKIGLTEEDVVELLGQPYKVYQATDAPDDYYVEGYSRKERRITGKVFIYIASEPIAYIYFDHDNKVEEVFVGGS